MKIHSNWISQAVPGLMGLGAMVVLSTTPVCFSSEEDFSYWMKAKFLVPITAQWVLGFEQKVGFEDEGRRLGHHTQDFSLGRTNAKGWLKLYGAVKTAHALTDERDDWIHEFRPHINIAVLSKFQGIDLVNRSRLEYRNFEADDKVWRFRHKLRVDSPVTFTPLQIEPYVAEEIFYNFNADRLYGNRVQAGLFIPLHERVRLDLFYLWRVRKEDDNEWSDANVIGSYFRIKI